MKELHNLNGVEKSWVDVSIRVHFQ